MKQGELMYEIDLIGYAHVFANMPGIEDWRIGMAPKLDYLHDYPVEAASFSGDTSKIRFANGAVIEGKSATEVGKLDLVGKVLITTSISESETVVYFGRVVNNEITEQSAISFIPTEYKISDPRFPDDQDYYPQRPVAEPSVAETIRDQFNSLDERAADGPVEEGAVSPTPEPAEGVREPENAPHDPVPSIELDRGGKPRQI